MATSYPTDSGTATPAANALTLTGGTGLNTSGAGAVATFNLDVPVLVSSGGTGAITLTDGGILLGSGVGAITVTAQPTNGQLLIGSTGVDPVLATLTAGTGVTITEGAGTITIDADAATPLSFPSDSGTATPAANALTVSGGTGINTSGAAAVITVNLDSPVTVANGGTGSTGITGIVAGNGTAYAGRTLTAPAAGITISNANGSSGNPTFALANDLEAVENLASAGVVSRTGASAWDVSSVTQYAVQVGDSGYKLASLSLGTSGQVLTSNGAGSNPSWQDAGGFNTTKLLNNVFVYDDFFCNSSTNILNSQLGWSTSFAVGNSLSPQPYTELDLSHPGQFFISMAAIGSGRVSNTGNNKSLQVGGGVITITWVMKIETLSNATDDYDFLLGLSDDGSTTPTNFIGWRYSHDLNSGDWQVVCTSASSETSANTSSTVDTNWHNYQIVINAAATSISFKIDGVEVANSPITTNIPSSTDINNIIFIYKNADTITNNFYFDLFIYEQSLTTPR